jgi:Glycosyltransferase Family 4
VTPPLDIALVSPHAWPPRDDVAHHVAAEARALAARGHRVAVLAPGTGRDRLAAGRVRLRRAADGDAAALLPPPGEVSVTAIGRALPAGAGRRIGGPFDVAAALETALAAGPFDVVHVHEPLAPSPVLAALRHAPAASAVTFHRAEQLAGVAFLRPLVDRALGRADLRVSTSEVGRRALADLLPGDYRVMRPGVDLGLIAPPPEVEPARPPGVVIVARGRDRVGARFALSVLRGLDLAALGTVTLLGPPEAPWRTRAAVPKVLRGAVEVVPDGGPEVRAAALASGRVAILATPADAAGPVLGEAMAAGLALLAPLSPELELEDRVHHGVEALLLPPFSRPAWSEAVAALAAEPARRGELGARAAAAGRAWGWDDVAAELEAAYRAALAAGPRGARPDGRLLADLRVAPGPGVAPADVVAACLERGLGAVAVAAPGDIAPARAVAAAAPPELAVIVGQQIASREGVVVGLFLGEAVPDALPLAATLAAVRAQGGLVLVPHPEAADIPSPRALRAHAGEIDVHEVLTPASGAGARTGEEAAALARRLGVIGSAGSGAVDASGVGTACVELRDFHGPEDFLEALSDARLVRRRRGGRPRAGRRRRPSADA